MVCSRWGMSLYSSTAAPRPQERRDRDSGRGRSASACGSVDRGAVASHLQVRAFHFWGTPPTPAVKSRCPSPAEVSPLTSSINAAASTGVSSSSSLLHTVRHCRVARSHRARRGPPPQSTAVPLASGRRTRRKRPSRGRATSAFEFGSRESDGTFTEARRSHRCKKPLSEQVSSSSDWELRARTQCT